METKYYNYVNERWVRCLICTYNATVEELYFNSLKSRKGINMKKRNNKLIVAMLVIAILASVMGGYGTAVDNIYTESAIFTDMPDQSAAIAANDLLWKTFTLDEAGMPIAYPEEYGGAFMEGELLYIYIVGLNDELKSKYLKICDNSNVVRFIEADYSANYLHSLFNEARKYIDEFDITGYGIDFRNNRFQIEIADAPFSASGEELDVNIVSVNTFELQKSRLSSKLDNDAIVIVPGAHMFSAETNSELSMRSLYNLRGGSALTGVKADGTTNSFSMAIGGTYGGTPAILTAGHCVSQDSATGVQDVGAVKILGVTMGVPIAYQYESLESGDWAIIRITNSNYIPTNEITVSTLGTNEIKSCATSIAPGQIVFYCGAVSGNIAGSIYLPNYTYIDSILDIEIRGLCSIQNASGDQAAKGDSGGTVYFPNANGHILAGNVSHYEILVENGLYLTLFNPIGSAINAGFTPYLS